MNFVEETPDRRFWTAYDHFKIEQEARAMRRAEIYSLASKLWQRIRASLATAGAQPTKAPHRKTASA